MSSELVQKLLHSFDELDRCILITKDILTKKEGIPENILERIDHYADIVKKQRILTQALDEHLKTQNWEEVGRHVRLINALSTMIRDDAQAILAGTFATEFVADQTKPVVS